MHVRLLSVSLVAEVQPRQEEERMRIHRSVKMGLAMGVMLISGGCAGDMLAPETAPAPREASVVEALAGKAQEVTVSREAGPPIRCCQCGGPQGAERPLVFVDGEELPLDGLRQLEPEDIESFEVLKGSAAIILYGDRAVDGVILVRTIRR
jgi:TonB-dependent starch-binding outer membrane protein SusC